MHVFYKRADRACDNGTMRHWTEKIDLLLKQQGRKRPWLAEQIGKPIPTVGAWFQRLGAPPDWPTATAIARVLEVDPLWLFDDTEDWPPPSNRPAGRPVEAFAAASRSRQGEVEELQALVQLIVVFGDDVDRKQLRAAILSLAGRAIGNVDTSTPPPSPAPSPHLRAGSASTGGRTGSKGGPPPPPHDAGSGGGGDPSM